MAKYIIDVPDNTQWIQWMNVSEKDGSACFDYKAPEDLTPYVRSESYIDGLKKGQNDAWEFARKIICPQDCCEDSISVHTKEIFNKEGWEIRGIFKDLSYQEAKTKYNEWRKQKDEIRVGDEVIPLDTQYDTMVVTKLWTSEFCDEWIDAIAGDGKAYSFLKTSIRKTGRHLDGVKKLMEEMRNGSDE